MPQHSTKRAYHITPKIHFTKIDSSADWRLVIDLREVNDSTWRLVVDLREVNASTLYHITPKISLLKNSPTDWRLVIDLRVVNDSTWRLVVDL